MKILTVVGARPQFVKAAMVSHAVATWNASATSQTVTEVLVHTGQHYDDEMSGSFFRELTLPRPAYDLGIGSGPHGQQTGRMLERLEEVMIAEQPDAVLVYGDTNSTLAGALAAAKLHVPVAHVEAGLRSRNRLMPEEVNRILVDHLSTLLFCPTTAAVENLSAEGITQGVSLAGDVMAEALTACLPAEPHRHEVVTRYGLTPGAYGLATIHRAENTDDRAALTGMLRALAAARAPVLLPCHPRTRKMIEAFDLAGILAGSSLRLVDPVGYLDMVSLEAEAAVVVTDSGGVQKEAYWLGVPCVTLREETEWVETVASGRNLLVGSDEQAIREALERAAALPRVPCKVEALGEEPASHAILHHLVSAERKPSSSSVEQMASG